MMGFADLHLHTTASDGKLTPRQSVIAAARRGISILAITDHDTLAGIAEACETGKSLGITVIPGLEISTLLDGEDVHILGYYIKGDSPTLCKTLKALRNARQVRIAAIVGKLNQLGYPLTFEEIVIAAGTISSLGRPHVARALVAKGYLSTVGEAFTTLLNQGMPAFVERFKLTPAQAIEVIEDAGGLAFIAHPGLLADSSGTLAALQASGLKGIEVFHPDHTPAQTEFFLAYAKEHKLWIAGGSDCHGEDSPASIRIDLDHVRPWLL
jgi:3',5'-nucleoside bisphosphate phosphatase